MTEQRFQTFKDVIAAWPSRREFSDETGITLSSAQKMYEVDSIRGVYFHAIVEASKVRHGDQAITAEDLCRIAARCHADKAA